MYCQISDVRGSTLKDLSSLELWCNFNIAKLPEAMRQRGEITLTDLLNKIRIGYIDEYVESVFIGKFIYWNYLNYPDNLSHIFVGNKHVRNHNDAMIQKLDSPTISLDATDQLTKGVTLSDKKLLFLSAKKPTDTGNISSRLVLKIGARVKLINNIDISDRLINGQIGLVKYIKSVAGKITKIYLSFDDNLAGIRTMSHDDL